MTSEPHSVPYQVKGSSLASKLEFVETRFGPAAVRELLLDVADPRLERILVTSWYPYELFDRLLTRLAARFYDGDLERLAEIGEYSAAKMLSGTYKTFTDLSKSYGDFLRRVQQLHSRLYSQGVIEVSVGTGDRRARILWHSAPYWTETDLAVAKGFYRGAAESFELRQVEVGLRREPDRVTFDLRWA